MGEKLEEKSLLCWGCEAAFTEHLAGCVRPLRQKGRGGEPLQLAGSWLLVLPAVPAQPHCGGRGRDGRGAGPSGSDTLWCCGGGRQEWALQGSRRAYRDSWEGGRSRVCSTAAFPSLICSKWERLVRLLDVISQGPGCGGQEGLFFGFFIQKEMSIWTWVGLHRSRNQLALAHLSHFALPQKWKRSKGILSWRGICV